MMMSNVDYVTDLPKDVLSFLIYAFFAASRRILTSTYKHLQYHKFSTEIAGYITGSCGEDLHLPVLKQLWPKEGAFFSDTDMMYEYRSNKIVVLSKNVRPGYCRFLFKGSNRLVSVKEVCEVMKPELALLATDPKSCKQCDV